MVTIHASEIVFNGWTGAGYTILDKVSGAGAYMIGGGADGGGTDIPAYAWMFALAAVLFVASLIVANPVLAIALLAGSILALGCGLSNYYKDGIYADWAGFIVSTVIIGILALLATSGGGLPALVIGGMIGGSLIATRFSSRCVGA